MGMELESQEWDRWLKWSEAEVIEKEQRSAAFSGAAPVTEEDTARLAEENIQEPDETVAQYVQPDLGIYGTEQRPVS